ncbi:MAG: hypothetical protein ACLP1D_03775 [Xanthobacteraceae bacterium]
MARSRRGDYHAIPAPAALRWREGGLIRSVRQKNQNGQIWSIETLLSPERFGASIPYGLGKSWSAWNFGYGVRALSSFHICEHGSENDPHSRSG